MDVVTRVMERVRRQRAERRGKTPDVEILIRQAEEIAGALRRFTQTPAPRPVPRAEPPQADAAAASGTTIEAQWPKGRISVPALTIPRKYIRRGGGVSPRLTPPNCE